MTNATLSPSVYTLRIGDSKRTSGTERQNPSTVRSQIVDIKAAIPPLPLQKRNTKFSELKSRINSDQAKSSALKEARSWVAETLLEESEETIQSLRLKLGMSQLQLAEAVGTTQAQIARIEKGNTDPKRSTCKKLRKALGITMDQLDDMMERQEQKYSSRIIE